MQKTDAMRVRGILSHFNFRRSPILHSAFCILHLPRQRRAFTFLEIMIVIMVLGVLSALALPRMKGGLINARLKAGTRDVAGVLRAARGLAVIREQPVEVRFVPNEDWYRILLLDERGDIDERENRDATKRRRHGRKREVTQVTLNDDVAGKRQLPEGIHFAAVYSAAPLTEDDDEAKENELPRAIFYPDGSATPATIVLQTDGEAAMAVELYRTTGLARVEAGFPEEFPDTQKRYYGPGDSAASRPLKVQD